MKYRILWNYGSERRSYHTSGNSSMPIEYSTVNEAVHAAVDFHTGTEFEVVFVTHWRAEYHSEE